MENPIGILSKEPGDDNFRLGLQKTSSPFSFVEVDQLCKKNKKLIKMKEIFSNLIILFDPELLLQESLYQAVVQTIKLSL